MHCAIIPHLVVCCFNFRMFMLILFIVELAAFMRTTVNTSVILDTNADVQLRINFNITMLDMSCEFATIDVYDVLGTNTQVWEYST
jgi:hypothetical protein